MTPAAVPTPWPATSRPATATPAADPVRPAVGRVARSVRRLAWWLELGRFAARQRRWGRRMDSWNERNGHTPLPDTSWPPVRGRHRSTAGRWSR